MAQTTNRNEPRQLALIKSMIPPDVARSLDPDELGDRLVEAARLLARATAETSPVLAKCHADQAKAMLAAPPREQTKATIRALMLKSARASSAEDIDRYRAEAERVKAAHPMAPRRRPPAVRKADANEAQVAVFDETGNLIGLVDKAKIIPVMSPAETKSAMAKAARARRQAR